jgi:hypothetical protein
MESGAMIEAPQRGRCNKAILFFCCCIDAIEIRKIINVKNSSILLQFYWYNGVQRGSRAIWRRFNRRRAPAGADAQNDAIAEGKRVMWQHKVGRVDFESPLFQLMRRGWDFRESTPTGDAQYGDSWAVIGVNGAEKVQVDGAERNEAWAEAVRLALIADVKRGPNPTAPCSSMMKESPDEPTVCEEERASLRAAGWSFSEHRTAQASGRAGWVVAASAGGQSIQAVDENRLDAWGAALILATVSGTAPTEPLTEHSAALRVGSA